MSDRYGYIAIETLLDFCENSKDHAVTPNDFMRMPRVRVPERKTGQWVNMIEKGLCYCDQCGFTQETERAFASLYCCKCGAAMKEGVQE